MTLITLILNNKGNVMNIKYIVGNYEHTGGGLSTNEEHEFNDVYEAIEFHVRQKDGAFSWWDILVKYEE
jgi:hypothetical protein